MAHPPDSSATKRPQETSASISALQRQWRIFRSAAGKTVSSALFTVRERTQSNSIQIRKSSLNAGRKSGPESSRHGRRQTRYPSSQALHRLTQKGGVYGKQS